MSRYLEKGQQALAQENYPLARRFLYGALSENDTPAPDLLLSLGMLHFKQKEWLESQKWLAKYVAHTFDAKVMLLLAQVYLKIGDDKKFKETLLFTLEKEATHLEAHLMLAQYLEEKEQYIEAIGSYFTVINIGGDRFDVCFSLALIYHKLGNLNYALAFMERALALSMNDYKALFNQAVILEELGYTERAIRSYKSSFIANPHYVEGYVNLISIYCRHQQLNKALQIANRGLYQNPDSPLLLYNRGLVHALCKDDLHAQKDLRLCVQKAPDFQEKIKAHPLLCSFI